MFTSSFLRDLTLPACLAPRESSAMARFLWGSRVPRGCFYHVSVLLV